MFVKYRQELSLVVIAFENFWPKKRLSKGDDAKTYQFFKVAERIGFLLSLYLVVIYFLILYTPMKLVKIYETLLRDSRLNSRFMQYIFFVVDKAILMFFCF